MTTPAAPVPPPPAGARTMLDVLADRAERLGARPAAWVRGPERWEPVSWRSYEALVQRCALGLHALGVKKGQGVCILSANRLEWPVADLAAMALGAVPAGIYATSTPEQVAYVVDHCEAEVIFVDDEAQLKKVLQVRAKLPRLRHVIQFGPPAELHDGFVIPWEALLQRGDGVPKERYAEAVAALEPRGLATLIYTSGTTGPPKGVMLTHENLCFTADRLTRSLGIAHEERVISYLPLSHIAEQLVTIHMALWNGVQVHFLDSLEKLKETLTEVRPSIFLGVPRVWEKLKAGIEGKVAEAPKNKQALFRKALQVGRDYQAAVADDRSPGLWLAAQHALFERLVFGKLRAKLGFDQTRAGFTAAAPIGRDVLEFFRALGLPVLEIYGQSEVTGPTTVNGEAKHRLGTVGLPILDTEVKLADDGEILVRGRHVFAGYYKDEAATREVLEPDGWLHSGDVGEFDPQGFLRITDRKKELIVTSGGKKTGPSNLEALLRRLEPIGHAVAIGDDRPYVVALLTLDPERAKGWCAANGVAFGGLASLSKEPALRAHLAQAIEREVNPQLARFETIKKFAILPDELQPGDDGELTPTMKLRRKIIARRRAAEIEALYTTSEA